MGSVVLRAEDVAQHRLVRKDLKDIELTWDEAEELAHSRISWRQCVSQCDFDMDELRSQVV